jgi:hypothetical protein
MELSDGGRAERCNGEGTWLLEGATLTLQWASVTSGNTQTDHSLVSQDGAWYTGRNQDGQPVHGWRIDEE